MAEVTIALVVYPGLDQQYLQQSIASARAQIAVDARIRLYFDGVPAIFPDPAIKLVTVPASIAGNIAAVRQLMIEDTDTPYIAFWDSDDIYTPDRLFRQLQLIKSAGTPLVAADFGYFDKQRIIEQSFFQQIEFAKREIDLLDENYIGMGILTARTEFLRSLLPFPPVHHLDWWIAVKTMRKGFNPAVVQKVLGFYRLHQKSLSNRMLSVSIDDFKSERRNKINLLQNLLPHDENIKMRLNFFRELDVDVQFQQLKHNFLRRSYKNIWGGLIPYAGH